jgi:hypothetical protein
VESRESCLTWTFTMSLSLLLILDISSCLPIKLQFLLPQKYNIDNFWHCRTERKVFRTLCFPNYYLLRLPFSDALLLPIPVCLISSVILFTQRHSKPVFTAVRKALVVFRISVWITCYPDYRSALSGFHILIGQVSREIMRYLTRRRSEAVALIG